jgi:hypothetical protein
MNDTPTTRRHPRTLWEAFPDVRAGWIEVGYRPWYWRVFNFIRRIFP